MTLEQSTKNLKDEILEAAAKSKANSGQIVEIFVPGGFSLTDINLVIEAARELKATAPKEYRINAFHDYMTVAWEG